MADHNDATLLVQLAQWSTAMGGDEASRAIMSDDFDPDSASVDDPNVDKVLMFGETIGTLTKHGLLDSGLVLDWLWVKGAWDRVAAAAVREREKYGVPELYENFEALAAKQT